MNQSIFTKVLIAFGFIITTALFGCSNSNENITVKNANINSNSNKSNTNAEAIKTPSAADLADKAKIEEALKKAGFNDIQVDANTTPITIRGTVPGDKIAEVNLIALQAAGKQVNNEIKEKK